MARPVKTSKVQRYLDVKRHIQAQAEQQLERFRKEAVAEIQTSIKHHRSEIQRLNNELRQMGVDVDSGNATQRRTKRL
jgi:hypothetical protein